MKKRNQPKSLFTLQEDNGVIIASLVDEYDFSLKHKIYDMPHPRVRAPRKSKAEIESFSKFWANDPMYGSQEQYLKKNINGCNQLINDHIQEIRKTLKRIQSLTHFIVTAEEILDEMQ